VTPEAHPSHLCSSFLTCLPHLTQSTTRSSSLLWQSLALLHLHYWFTSYLTDRTHSVTWNGSLSRPCILDTGVPQGSVLGPFLFYLHTKSLGSVITSHGFCYQMTPNCSFSSPPLTPKLQHASLNAWLAQCSLCSAAGVDSKNIDNNKHFFSKCEQINCICFAIYSMPSNCIYKMQSLSLKNTMFYEETQAS